MSKNKRDIGSKMSFNNLNRDYSLKDKKNDEKETEKIVKIDIDLLDMAPAEWNFYPPLSDEEFDRLVYSILENGLLHPIVVRREGEKHIILSGHNRVRAYKKIFECYNDLEKGLEVKYSLPKHLFKSDFVQILCILKEDISDDDAKEIIIDANYVQRKLSPKLITKSVIEKYKIVQNRRNDVQDYKSQKTRDVVAKEFKLSGRHIDRYKKLDSLNSDILELFYEGKISLELASKIALLKDNVQNKIATDYIALLPKYPGKIAKNLKAGLSIKDIVKIFNDEVLPEDKMIINIRHQGRGRNIEIKDDKLKQKILDLIEKEIK